MIKIKQIYIITKLFNVHDRLSSQFLCNEIDSWIDQNLIQNFSKCFLPYRDSNELVKDKPNPTHSIFQLDCETIKESYMLIGYLDGPVYDSGIGFELGFAYVLEKPIIILTSDYFEKILDEKKVSISPLVETIATIIHVKSIGVHGNNYYENQLIFRKKLNNLLLETLCEKKSIKKNNIPISFFEKQVDLLIDAEFNKTFSSNLVLDLLKQRLSDKNISFHILNEADYSNIELLISKINSAKNILIYGDYSFDCNIDSSVLHGMAYALGKKVILFSSRNESLYQSENFILHKNPMIEYSSVLIKDVDSILNEIK